MPKSTLSRLMLVLAWAALALIAYATLTRVQFVYVIYGRMKPFLLGASAQTWAHIEHIVAFGTAGVLFAVAYPRRPFLACLIVTASAVLFEVLQTLTPDRHGTLIDASEKIVAGCLGVALAVLARRSWLARRAPR
jgi:VanZ family protein